MGLTGHVLVLNQNYEPMTICHVKKALILVFLGKAEIIEAADGRVLRSVNAVFPFPSIVRLCAYVYKKRKGVMLSRKNILKRDNFQCQYCGTKAHSMTVDHIIPKVHGGKDTWENLITACIHCNNKKGDQSPEDAGMALRTKPRKPNPLSFIQGHANGSNETWRQYLFMS